MESTVPSTTDSSLSLSEYIPKDTFSDREDCPVSKAEYDHQFKKREENGFSKAFVKISARTFLLHIPTYIECLKAKRGA